MSSSHNDENQGEDPYDYLFEADGMDIDEGGTQEDNPEATVGDSREAHQDPTRVTEQDSLAPNCQPDITSSVPPDAANTDVVAIDEESQMFEDELRYLQEPFQGFKNIQGLEDTMTLGDLDEETILRRITNALSDDASPTVLPTQDGTGANAVSPELSQMTTRKRQADENIDEMPSQRPRLSQGEAPNLPAAWHGSPNQSPKRSPRKLTRHRGRNAAPLASLDWNSQVRMDIKSIRDDEALSVRTRNDALIEGRVLEKNPLPSDGKIKHVADSILDRAKGKIKDEDAYWFFDLLDGTTLRDDVIRLLNAYPVLIGGVPMEVRFAITHGGKWPSQAFSLEYFAILENSPGFESRLIKDLKGKLDRKHLEKIKAIANHVLALEKAGSRGRQGSPLFQDSLDLSNPSEESNHPDRQRCGSVDASLLGSDESSVVPDICSSVEAVEPDSTQNNSDVAVQGEPLGYNEENFGFLGDPVPFPATSTQLAANNAPMESVEALHEAPHNQAFPEDMSNLSVNYQDNGQIDPSLNDNFGFPPEELVPVSNFNMYEAAGSNFDPYAQYVAPNTTSPYNEFETVGSQGFDDGQMGLQYPTLGNTTQLEYSAPTFISQYPDENENAGPYYNSFPQNQAHIEDPGSFMSGQQQAFGQTVDHESGSLNITPQDQPNISSGKGKEKPKKHIGSNRYQWPEARVEWWMHQNPGKTRDDLPGVAADPAAYHGLWSECTPPNVDISVLHGVNLTVEEMLTYFPFHTAWHAFGYRLARNGWTAPYTCKFILLKHKGVTNPRDYPRDTVNGQLAKAEAYMDGLTQPANRQNRPKNRDDFKQYTFGGCNKHNTLTGENSHLIGDWYINDLDNGVSDPLLGQERGALTMAMLHAREHGHRVLLSEVSNYIRHYNLDPGLPMGPTDPNLDVAALQKHKAEMKAHAQKIGWKSTYAGKSKAK